MPQHRLLRGIHVAAEGVQGEVGVTGGAQEGEEVPEFDADWGLETLVHVGEHWIDSLLQVRIPLSVTSMHHSLFSLDFQLLGPSSSYAWSYA